MSISVIKKKKDLPNGSGPASFAVMKNNNNISSTPMTSKSLVRASGVNFGKIKILVFMVLKAEVWTCKLRGHEKKKKDFPNTLDIKVTRPDLWRQFRKYLNFFMVLEAQVRI